jgi:hypothetical protein
MSNDDVWDDPATKRWADQVITEMLPKMRDSSAVMSIIPKNAELGDVKLAVEIGFSILLDKPLIAIVQTGAIVPEHLIRAADAIVECDLGDADAPAKLAAAMKRVLG